MIWLTLLSWLRKVPVWAWGALAAVALTWAAYAWAYGRGADSVRQDWNAAIAQAALDAAAQAAEAEAVERKQAAAFASARTKLTKENTDALAVRDRLIACLRDGTCRLRDRFTCPRAVPGTAGSPARSDEAGEGGLLPTDAEFLVRLATEADTTANRLTACQSILQAERQ